MTLFKKLLSPFGNLVKRHQRGRLRQLMRGYRKLKQSGQLYRISAVKRALTESSLGLPASDFSSVVMGGGVSSGELVVRQYLLVLVAGQFLNRTLLYASAKDHRKVVLPFPRVWREILSQHGFEVAHFRSAVIWQVFVCALLIYGAYKIFKTLVTRSYPLGMANSVEQPHAYFSDLGKGSIPSISNGSYSRDVISWYLQWPGRSKNIQAVCHNVDSSSPVLIDGIEVRGQPTPLPIMVGGRKIAEYAFWGAYSIIIAFIDLLRGRWWHALLLNQVASSLLARSVFPESLAKEYLFNVSAWLYRPLWTYDVEQRGASVIFYFYSTNCEGFKTENLGYPPIPYGWKAMSWPRYLVWDQYQADFVRCCVGESVNISVVGPIWFQDCSAALPALPKKSVAVFDVQPVRESVYRELALDFDYYVPETTIRFLSDSLNTVGELGGSLVLKRKRQIGNMAHPRYRQYTSAITKHASFIAVDPEISAMRLIKECDAVISMPFTSTALLGGVIGKPSVYYDPCGLLQSDDRAAHGVRIVKGPDELQVWLGSILGNVPIDCEENV